jgi:hypothetical protein
MTALTAENVKMVVMDVLFRDDEVQDGSPRNLDDLVMVEGLVNKFGLHKGRLESHRQDVADMLRGLPDGFRKSGGGGMSFLDACVDREGVQWGEHRDIDSLFVLGMGLGLAKYCAPREMWKVLPGGVPYMVVDV